MHIGWSECRLGELFDIKHGYAFKGQHFSASGDYVLLTPGNFKSEGGLKLKGESEKYYRGDFPREFLLDTGDLLVAMTDLTQDAPILGSPLLVPESGRFLHNQRLGRIIKIREDRVTREFLFYLFCTPLVRAQIKASASGATVRHTSPSRIGEVRAPLPSISLQKRLAEILSAYDDLVVNNLRRIQILEEMSRALYREWFVELRAPGLSRVGRSDLPDRWRLAKLASIADVNRAQINPKAPPDRLLYIDISSVGPGFVREVSDLQFSEAPGRARRVVQHGDILWSCVRPNRRSHALTLNPDPNTVASTGFAVLTATKVPFTFLYQAVTTDAFVTYLANHATGAAYPAVTAKTFEDAEVLLPSAVLLERFAQATTPMADLIANLQRQNANLRATRDLLLPRLMSGQLRLPDVEAEPLAAEPVGAKG